MSKKSVVLAILLLVAAMALAACGGSGGTSSGGNGDSAATTEAGAAPNVPASDATVTSEAQDQATGAGNDTSGAGDTSGANATGEASSATDVGSGSDGAQGSGGSNAASGATSPESDTGAPAAGDDTGNVSSGTGGTADASGNTTDSGGSTGGEGGTGAQVATPSVSYTAVSDAECTEIQGQLNTALGVEVNRGTGVTAFTDLNGSTGESCQLTVTGTGANFKSVPETAALIRQTLTTNGWTADEQYAADSPTATIGALRRDNQLAAYNVEWSPADGVTCPSDQPISACAETLTPEQMNYSITIDLAQQ